MNVELTREQPVTIITVTGPGADRLPWDEDHCAHRRKHRHRGHLGCRVQERAAREWADTLTYRWKLLRDAARLATRRASIEPPLILERVWELQKRGVAHAHLIVPYGDVVERQAAQHFADELARLAPAHDFGFVDTRLRAFTATEAAKYLAAYLVGASTKRKASIVELAAAERERRRRPGLGGRLPAMPLWVSFRLTRATGVTMRSLRRARHLWACSRDFDVPRPNWTGLAEVIAAAHTFRVVYRRGPPVPDVAERLAIAREFDRDDWYDARALARFASYLHWEWHKRPAAGVVELPTELAAPRPLIPASVAA
jgi:hypothetical protein